MNKETTLDNLRPLCAECNVGKAARMETDVQPCARPDGPPYDFCCSRIGTARQSGITLGAHTHCKAPRDTGPVLDSLS